MKTGDGGGLADDRGERPLKGAGAREGSTSARLEAVTPTEKEPGRPEPG